MKVTMLASLLIALSAGAAAATTANYSDFSSVAGLTLNGSAAQVGSVLRLVPNADSQAGTAFLSSAVPFDASTGFSTSFKFNVATSTADPTDGFSFILQSDAAGAAALGAAGQGLGYVGLTPSVAVVFRGRDPNLIGVITGGVDPADPSINFQPPGYYSGTQSEFYNKDEFVWIDYNASNTQLSVYLAPSAVKPLSPIMATTVNIFGVVGSDAYIGFGAGNGGAFGTQDVLNWSFAAAPVPEPGTAGMLALGVLCLTLLRRRMFVE